MDFINQYLNETQQIINQLDTQTIHALITLLVELKEKNGRLFILGVGGSAANASHAVNDFRKIVGIEAYSPIDNVSELTARTNDEGWESVFSQWLKVSQLNAKDMLFILSVGGGNEKKNVSVNLIKAIDYAKQCQSKIIGITGRDGGYTAKKADACLIIPTISASNTTPHAEAFQAMIWHLLVSHPSLKSSPTKWESIQGYATEAL